jgi:transposase
LEALCPDAGVVLEFLPPYFPDFNPIEESFVEMKAWRRKNYTLQKNYEEFEGFLEVAVRNMAAKAGNHFRSCHIVVPELHNEE